MWIRIISCRSSLIPAASYHFTLASALALASAASAAGAADAVADDVAAAASASASGFVSASGLALAFVFAFVSAFALEYILKSHTTASRHSLKFSKQSMVSAVSFSPCSSSSLSMIAASMVLGNI